MQSGRQVYVSHPGLLHQQLLSHLEEDDHEKGTFTRLSLSSAVRQQCACLVHRLGSQD